MFTRTPQLLTRKTAADYVATQCCGFYSWKVNRVHLLSVDGEPVAMVKVTGTNLYSGESFLGEWQVWVEPERGNPSGLYGEW